MQRQWLPPTDANLNSISQEFSFNEIRRATDNFSKENSLGKGTYGTVYRGTLRDGTEVAVKVLTCPKSSGFQEEVEVLSKFRHPNLVILMGFARGLNKERLLVYELLETDVCNKMSTNEIFGWKERISVALDAVLGLSHLHCGNPKVFHRDIKTQNILLDRNNNAKVADFGLACLAQKDALGMQVENCSGTIGYADPLYINTSMVTEKSEVYSFGMVMLEMLTGRPPALQMNNGRIEYQFEDVKRFGIEKLFLMLDSRAEWPVTMARQFANVALSCIDESEQVRPTCADIVRTLRTLLRSDEFKRLPNTQQPVQCQQPVPMAVAQVPLPVAQVPMAVAQVPTPAPISVPVTPIPLHMVSTNRESPWSVADHTSIRHSPAPSPPVVPPVSNCHNGYHPQYPATPLQAHQANAQHPREVQEIPAQVPNENPVQAHKPWFMKAPPEPAQGEFPRKLSKDQRTPSYPSQDYEFFPSPSSKAAQAAGHASRDDSDLFVPKPVSKENTVPRASFVETIFSQCHASTSKAERIFLDSSSGSRRNMAKTSTIEPPKGFQPAPAYFRLQNEQRARGFQPVDASNTVARTHSTASTSLDSSQHVQEPRGKSEVHRGIKSPLGSARAGSEVAQELPILDAIGRKSSDKADEQESVEVNGSEIVKTLVAMGFSPPQVEAALQRCSSVEGAVEYLFTHEI